MKFLADLAARLGAGRRKSLPEPYAREHAPIATEEDIYYCFRLLLDRTPGKKEWHGHRLTAGTDLQEIVAKFMSSSEFRSLPRRTAALAETAHEIVELDTMRLYISSADKVCGNLRTAREYEPGVTALIRRILRPGMSFVDVGANIGYFTVLASKLVGDTGRVIAVEPYPYNVKVLQANLRLNACRNVSILPLALADKRGLLRYDDSAGNSGNVLESKAGDLGEDLAGLLQSCLVYAVRLDDEIEAGDAIDLIKMDIEGAEYIALQGMERIRKRSRPIIISELAEDFMRNVSGVPLSRYLDELLADPDYRLGVVHPAGPVELFGRATQAVLEAYARQESMCLDIVAYPADKEASIVAAGPSVADPDTRGG